MESLYPFLYFGRISKLEYKEDASDLKTWNQMLKISIGFKINTKYEFNTFFSYDEDAVKYNKNLNLNQWVVIAGRTSVGRRDKKRFLIIHRVFLKHEAPEDQPDLPESVLSEGAEAKEMIKNIDDIDIGKDFL